MKAQTIDTGILGTVRDPCGAAVAGAELTVTTVATGASGFRSVRRSGVVLQLSQQARVDFVLELGQLTERVEVSASASLLQTENAVLGAVVGSKGSKLDTSVNNWNSPDPGPGTIQLRRPYPAVGPHPYDGIAW